ncbi:MAG: helix-turn-helix transcriptional regulator [Oscillospiraceae bacterium]|nr:helix-turn-helix transcriptional regulator [Oscillospiraceae bacterium]
MLDAKIVGMVIQQVREKKRQSQELTSGLAGIGRTHLSAIERGERKPTLDTFFKISDALQIRPRDLIAQIEEAIKEVPDAP